MSDKKILLTDYQSLEDMVNELKLFQVEVAPKLESYVKDITDGLSAIIVELNDKLDVRLEDIKRDIAQMFLTEKKALKEIIEETTNETVTKGAKKFEAGGDAYLTDAYRRIGDLEDRVQKYLQKATTLMSNIALTANNVEDLKNYFLYNQTIVDNHRAKLDDLINKLQELSLTLNEVKIKANVDLLNDSIRQISKAAEKMEDAAETVSFLKNRVLTLVAAMGLGATIGFLAYYISQF